MLLLFSSPAAARAQDSGHYAQFRGAPADGTRVFFETTEPLVSADNDNRVDLYRRHAGETIRLSGGEINGNGSFGAFFQGASADGTRVFFRTAEPLVPADLDGARDVYVLAGGTTTLVSAGEINGNGELGAFHAGASLDGSPAFFTTAERLTAADEDDAADIYERSMGTTTLVSAGDARGRGSAELGVSFHAASADGSRVFFTTAESLVAEDTDDVTDIYERSAGVTTLVSAGEVNASDGGHTIFGDVSADGTRVVFATPEQLVASDTDGLLDVYERAGGVTTQVSVGEIIDESGSAALFGGASEDGSRIFFSTRESLVASDTDGGLSDVYQRSAGATTLISAGEPGARESSGVFFGGASADGARVFWDDAGRLVANDADSVTDVYEYAGGTTSLVSAGAINGNEAISADYVGASADGTRVFFRTTEALVAHDGDEQFDVYERSNGETTLISTGNGGTDAAVDAFFAGASVDGSRVFFNTDGAFVQDDADDSRDLYERAAGTTRLVSVEVVPPRTSIRKGPRKRTRQRRPAFVLRSSEPGSSYRCRVASEWFACETRTKLPRLKRGRHVFRARAIDPAGNEDESAARRVFRVAG